MHVLMTTYLVLGVQKVESCGSNKLKLVIDAPRFRSRFNLNILKQVQHLLYASRMSKSRGLQRRNGFQPLPTSLKRSTWLEAMMFPTLCHFVLSISILAFPPFLPFLLLLRTVSISLSLSLSVLH